ncbi:MAG: beta-L-arabinofuranosidase domain-containing protein [Bacillota bacterium]
MPVGSTTPLVGGDRQILDACLIAWQDIVENRLYLTGTASHHEHFHDNFDLPNTGNVGETCVTVTWLQFNAQLLRLTGEARFAEELEKVVLNQLFGAQWPDCAAWGYYVEMEGKKPYSATLDGHCCLSSGPRGVALIPTFAMSTDADGVVVNLYDAGKAQLTLRDQTSVAMAIETMFPSDGRVRIAVNPPAKKAFAVKLRVPAWCREASAKVNGQALDLKCGADGYAAIAREWKSGDAIELNLKLEPRVVVGDHKQAGKVAVLYGPLVLAADAALLGEGEPGLSAFAAAGPDLAALGVTPEPAPQAVKTWAGSQVFKIKAVTRRATENAPAGSAREIRLIPFADAGGTGSRYQIWLPLPGTGAGASLLFEGKESRSRWGNLSGSINDDPPSAVVTFDGKNAAEDWFAVTLDQPVAIRRVVFQHGKTFHDGGWFDAAGGKPRVQVQKSKGGAWETIGTLDEYAQTTATDSKGLKEGQVFTLRLAEPLKVFGVRVIGKPAGGDNASQAFSSCGGLKAFAN